MVLQDFTRQRCGSKQGDYESWSNTSWEMPSLGPMVLETSVHLSWHKGFHLHPGLQFWGPRWRSFNQRSCLWQASASFSKYTVYLRLLSLDKWIQMMETRISGFPKMKVLVSNMLWGENILFHKNGGRMWKIQAMTWLSQTTGARTIKKKFAVEM